MKKLELSHELTPQSLVGINQELEVLLAAEELDDDRLKILVESRDTAIIQHLSSLSEGETKAFAALEIDINRHLSDIVQGHFRASLKQLSGLKRGHKAVKKYK